MLDRSFFEKVGTRNVFRYRTESVHRTFRAKSLKNAKQLASKHLTLLLKKHDEKDFGNLVTARLYYGTPIQSSRLRYLGF